MKHDNQRLASIRPPLVLAIVGGLFAVIALRVVLKAPPAAETPATAPVAETMAVFTRVDASKAYGRLRGHLDARHPGRGIADYPGFPITDVPKAYAMIAIAEIDRCRRDSGHDPGLADACVQWLLEHADENRDGIIGWGVPVAWDAYGDGSENPPDTEYAISTSLVVQALLDWADFAPDRDRSRIETIVGEALRTWAEPARRSGSGMIAYSLRESDRRYDTFNPAAHLAGQMQRFTGRADPELAARLSTAADDTMRILLEHVQEDPDGNWYWNYSIQEGNPNDLAHAVYIMHGIDSYAAGGGRLRERFDLPRIAGHMNSFVPEDDAFLSAWPTFREDIAYPARSYDIGAGLWYAASRPGLEAISERIGGFIPMYLKDDGLYRKYPDAGDKVGGDETAIGEYQAYILAGLSAFSR
ncbi:MAG: hypothetical protein GY895_20520 [Phycisphaera sp.]|nr:hypothetical protein [Phycisphaera sp.]